MHEDEIALRRKAFAVRCSLCKLPRTALRRLVKGSPTDFPAAKTGYRVWRWCETCDKG